MFRHEIREKPVLYKEILKAISKRELLEDLCFCACRKRSFAWRLSPSLLASSLTPLPFGLRWLARSAHDAAQAIPLYKLGLCQALALT